MEVEKLLKVLKKHRVTNYKDKDVHIKLSYIEETPKEIDIHTPSERPRLTPPNQSDIEKEKGRLQSWSM